jgi:hypothetical protein
MKAKIEERDKESKQKLDGKSGWEGKQEGASGKTDLRMDIFGEAAKYYVTQQTPHIPNTGERLTNYPLYAKQNAVPGGMVIEFLPVYGSNKFMKPNSTLKGVASRIWQSLRNHCTTAVNYQPGDVLVTLLQLYSYPMRLKQVFRRMQAAYITDDERNLNNNRLFEVLNRSGQDRSYAIANMQDFVNTYLDIVKYFNDFKVPDFFPIFHRWENMLGTFFSDIEPIEGQAFQYYIFDTTTQYQTRLGRPDEVEGWHVDPYQDPGDIESALNAMQQEITDIYEDSTVNFILGDLKRTYEDVNPWQLEPITLADVQAGPKPVYDPEMLYALYHASVLDVTSPSLVVNPNSGVLEGLYTFNNENAFKLALNKLMLKHPKLFNAMKADMTPDEFRKYTCWTVQQDTWDDLTAIQEPGPEILRSLTIFYNEFDEGEAFGDEAVLTLTPEFTNSLYCPKTGAISAELYSNTIFEIAQAQTFAWSPMFTQYSYEIDAADLPSNFQTLGVLAELELPFYLDSKNIRVWHDTIRQSLWNTPFSII